MKSVTKRSNFFLQCLHRYYVTCIKSVPIAMHHVWLIITCVCEIWFDHSLTVFEIFQACLSAS